LETKSRKINPSKCRFPNPNFDFLRQRRCRREIVVAFSQNLAQIFGRKIEF